MSQAIIVPLDGSERSERALPWAAELSALLEQPVTLLQVLPWEPRSAGARTGPFEISENLRAELQEAARAYLNRLRQRLLTRGIDVHVELATGSDIVAAILDAADEHGARAIVMASHGYGGLTRFMTGSVAQRVAQRSLIPTLIVRTSGPAPDRASLKKLIVPLDGSSFSESSIELVNDIAGHSCEIILARVIDRATGLEPPIDTAVSQAASSEYLSKHGKALERAGFKVHTVVRAGDPEEEIRRIADEQGADLIVMATHGRGGMSRFLAGSTTDAMIRTARQPVLVMNARALAAHSLEAYSVRDILRYDVTRLRPDDSLQMAMVKLLRHGETGAPVADGNRKLLGFVSEHDLLNWHARYVEGVGKDDLLADPVRYCEQLERITVASVMSTPAVAVEIEAPIAAAVELLLKHRFHRLPVTSDGRLVGTVDGADILGILGARDAQIASARVLTDSQ